MNSTVYWTLKEQKNSLSDNGVWVRSKGKNGAKYQKKEKKIFGNNFI